MSAFDEWFDKNNFNSQLKEILYEAYEKGARDVFGTAYERGYNRGFVEGVKKEQEWEQFKPEEKPDRSV